MTDICACDNGKIGKKQRELANKKRKDFYKSTRGTEIVKQCKELVNTRKELLEKVMELKTITTLGAMEKETIIRLLARMK